MHVTVSRSGPAQHGPSGSDGASPQGILTKLHSPYTELGLFNIPGALRPKAMEAVLLQVSSPAPAPLGPGCDAERLL